ncbi:type II toxin-antitoxin system RelE family toxin, partial [Streptomyces sp. NRRL B-1347]|uniref:type II toxin-antitoxin system RelE family toxin n=1 Tax=Streptomyces sp. NRRL B-1347 TaxID=1476877 RepID=UPI0004C48C57
MNYTIVWHIDALQALRRFADDDPDGVKDVRAAVATLALDARPPGSYAYGPDYARLRIGDYRVTYEINAGQLT